MHTEITANQSQDAMPAFTRRAVIAGAAAAIGGDRRSDRQVGELKTDDVLEWLIDAHDELKAALCEIEVAVKSLYQRADRPAWPEVQLVDWSVLSAPDGSYSATMADRSGNEVTVRADDGVHFSPAGQAFAHGGSLCT